MPNVLRRVLPLGVVRELPMPVVLPAISVYRGGGGGGGGEA